MSSIKIFVEGIADAKFIKDFVAFHYQVTLAISEKNKFQHGDIIDIGGKDGVLNSEQLAFLKPIFQMNTDQGGKNIVILDADDEHNQGGYSIRKASVETIIEQENLAISFFLFPNNNDNGDLESLLFEIINPINLPIFDCWNSYEECLRSVQIPEREIPLTTPANKTKAYAYLEALLGSSKSEKDKIKERNRDYQNIEHWNLNASYLQPLKTFFDRFYLETVH